MGRKMPYFFSNKYFTRLKVPNLEFFSSVWNLRDICRFIDTILEIVFIILWELYKIMVHNWNFWFNRILNFSMFLIIFSPIKAQNFIARVPNTVSPQNILFSFYLQNDIELTLRLEHTLRKSKLSIMPLFIYPLPRTK